MQTPHRVDTRSIWRAALALSVIVFGQVALAGQGSLEYQVKAAFLYNFVSFTQWPSSAFPSASSPLRLCVLRDEVFAAQLETTVSGDVVQGHALTVDRVERDEEAARCHVLFIPRQETPRAGKVLRDLGTAPVLTVGESDAFLRDGGIVNFVVENGHVRFDVNQKIARARALTLSSRLLQVARSVR